MEDHIDISGLDRAELLAALYNSAKPFGMGKFHFRPGDMTVEQARTLLAATGDDRQHIADAQHSAYFDYLYGRLLKVDLGGDTLDPWLYDRDYGQGAAAKIVAEVRAAHIAEVSA